MIRRYPDDVERRGISLSDVNSYTRAYNQRLFELHSDAICGTVVDLGSGGDDSERYNELAESDIRYVAVDFVENDGIDLRADGRKLPFRTDSIDTVVASAMLYQLPLHEVETVLREIRRVLKADGTCLAWVPFVYQLHSQPHDYFRPSQFGLETAFVDAGFEETFVYACGFYHQVLLQVLYGEYSRVCELLGLPTETFRAIVIPVALAARLTDKLATGIGVRRPWRENWPVGSFVRAHPSSPSDSDK